VGAPNFGSFMTNYEFSDCNILTSSDRIKNSSEYKIISGIISRMITSGVINLGSGFCISMSDMIYVALKQQGIESRLVECQTTFCYENQNPPVVVFLGHDQIKNPGEISTHVVVVTMTDTPMLIDASIAHRLPMGFPVIVDECNPMKTQDFNFAELYYPEHQLKVTYSEKRNQIVPLSHQVSVVDRITTDKKIFKNLGLLKILIVIALCISMANALRGAYDFYSVYYLENNWGPRALEKIEKRLENLEKR
jgi:hypothetical protein